MKQGESLKQGEVIHGLGFCKMSSIEGEKGRRSWKYLQRLIGDNGICAEQQGK